MNRLICLCIAAIVYASQTFAADVYLFTATGATTWTAPATGYYEVWTQGGGAGGGGGAGSPAGCGYYGGGGKAGGAGQIVRAKMYFTSGEVVNITNGAAGAAGIGSNTCGAWGGMSESGGNSYVKGLAAGGGAQAHGGPPMNTAAAGQTGHGDGGGAGADGNGTNGTAGSSNGSGGGGGGGVPPGYGTGGNGGIGKQGWARIAGPLS